MRGLAAPREKFGLYFKGCGKPLVGLKPGSIKLELEHALIYEQLIIL